jgi:acyl-CoA synthetase (AMP-forming)/AMP-acid ligase II
MWVPLTIRDHLDRALAVYPDRVAFVDEPDQPAPSLGETTFRELGVLSRAMGVGLDRLGLPMGGRVAVVSQNASRLLTCFWGVSGNGRIFVPINFRLSKEEVAYIVGHSGADVLLVDPELDEHLSGIDCRHRFVLGPESDEPCEVQAVPNEGNLKYLMFLDASAQRAHDEKTNRFAVIINAPTLPISLALNSQK